jgi:hypothetical protein
MTSWSKHTILVMSSKSQLQSPTRITNSAGYAGTFYINDSTNNVQVLSSVFRHFDSNDYMYDADVTSQVQGLVQQAHKQQRIVSGEITFQNERLQLFVARVDQSYFVKDDVDWKLLPDYYPALYFIRGTSMSRYDSEISTQYAASLSCLFISFAAMAASSIALYLPIRKLAHSFKRDFKNLSRHQENVFESLFRKARQVCGSIQTRHGNHSEGNITRHTETIKL